MMAPKRAASSKPSQDKTKCQRKMLTIQERVNGRHHTTRLRNKLETAWDSAQDTPPAFKSSRLQHKIVRFNFALHGATQVILYNDLVLLSRENHGGSLPGFRTVGDEGHHSGWLTVPDNTRKGRGTSTWTVREADILGVGITAPIWNLPRVHDEAHSSAGDSNPRSIM
ncbi:hypothetical protein AAG570_013146 [Ranatra chinensis]|uniref:Uncharacterized protein n=1 Tax=Ranatra chinensis TaxID=642074 RepID=A0ABD0Z265_9HEMI